MPATFDAIATTTLGSAASTITFSSIPGTYTDLRLVLTAQSSAGGNVWLQFNSDTATNYSRTNLAGDGTSATSSRQTSQSVIRCATIGVPTSPNFGLYTIDIFSYAGSTNKTVLVTASEDTNGGGGVSRIVGLWRSTAAISSIQLTTNTGTYSAGTTATLYGILKA